MVGAQWPLIPPGEATASHIQSTMRAELSEGQVRQLEEQLRIMDQTLKALMAAEDKVLIAHV